jgi:hypothetical protein
MPIRPNLGKKNRTLASSTVLRHELLTRLQIMGRSQTNPLNRHLDASALPIEASATRNTDLAATLDVAALDLEVESGVWKGYGGVRRPIYNCRRNRSQRHNG